MNKEDRIDVGDTVTIHFANHRPMRDYLILTYPTATGDAWGLKSPNGAIVYVQQYDYMIRTKSRYDKSTN